MDNNSWAAVEFAALRQEILALGEAERSAVKFYIPAVAVVYAIPYYLSERMGDAIADPRRQAFLWTFCVLVAELLTLAMLQSLFWSTDGARRLGVYIKTAIEPLTEYQLRWESVFHELTQERKQFFSDSSTVGAISVLVNIFAACAIGFAFLDNQRFWWPILPTSVMTGISCVVLRRIASSKTSRRTYAERYRNILATKSYIEDARKDSPSAA
ncbi:MAG: hypothetical protein M3P06_16005 [Acidobacteriota bacterium]|nr:hypothetical protein [Acidobacteriota bacterium]